jgi:hypothetical protein
MTEIEKSKKRINSRNVFDGFVCNFYFFNGCSVSGKC